MKTTVRCVTAVWLVATFQLAFADTPTQVSNCLVGTYRLRDGSDVDIAPGREAHLLTGIDGSLGDKTGKALHSWGALPGNP